MINGRKSGRSRGRRKICCGAAALASCLPLCLTAAEAGEYSEVSTHQTITEETHNTEKTRFAVTDKEQNRGGALLLEAPYFLAGGSVFEGNQAVESGGALYISEGSKLTIQGGASFTGNTAGEKGGAVYVQSDGSIINKGPLTFSGNSAQDGGAVYLESPGSNSSSNSLASGTSFTGNTGTGSGGALYISEGSYLTLYGGSSFTGNTAGDKGGAIYNSGTLVLDTTDGDITFTDNKAGGKGNDIHLGQSQTKAPLITITGTHSVTLTGGLTMDSTRYNADALDGEAPSIEYFNPSLGAKPPQTRSKSGFAGVFNFFLIGGKLTLSHFPMARPYLRGTSHARRKSTQYPEASERRVSF